MRLILHIGLHKTGTTGLQANLLQGKSGFIGKSHNTDDRAPYEVKEIADLATYYHSLADDEISRRLARWLDRLEAINSTLAGGIALKISEERISNWPMSTLETRWPIYYGAMARRTVALEYPKLPFATLLATHLAPAARARGIELAIVLTLRSQAEWLGSFYAQASNRILRAGQSNFETQLERLVATADPRLDYFGIVSSIADVVGKQNVSVLLQEEMGSREFWGRVIEVFELTDACISDALFSRQNAKAVSAERWKLSRPKGALARLIGSEEAIELTAELRGKIRQACAAGNAKLSEWLGKDLSQLGY